MRSIQLHIVTSDASDLLDVKLFLLLSVVETNTFCTDVVH